MAKSKIINDLASGECNLSTSLKRLYVILSNLNDEELQSWVRKELNGYSDSDKVPSYRKVRCIPTGSYGVVIHNKLLSFSGKPLPMIELDTKTKKTLSNCELRMSVDAINHAFARYKDGYFMEIPIPMELWSLFQKGTAITVTGASCVIDESEVQRVLNNIESKVLDLSLFLEKKFGNLDNLDISTDDYSKSDLQDLVESCKQIVFENCTFQNFDNTKIKAKNIASENAKIDNKKTIKTNKNSNTGKGNNYIEKHTDIKTDVEVNIQKQEKEKKECWFKRFFHKRSK